MKINEEKCSEKQPVKSISVNEFLYFDIDFYR